MDHHKPEERAIDGLPLVNPSGSLPTVPLCCRRRGSRAISSTATFRRDLSKINRVAFKPQGNKTFVFTLNDDTGHVFRFIQAETGLSVRAWPEQGKDAHAESLLARTVKTPPLADDKWTNVNLKFAGNKCTVKVGDFTQVVEHAAIGKEKTKLGLGFSFGTLSLKDVVIETP